MRRILRLSVLALAGGAIAGCSQVQMTANSITDGTARLADTTTNAVRSTTNTTTNTGRDIDARSQAARVKFVHSQYAMIKREAARGRGEDLDALAYMMQASDKQAFRQTIQAHYQTLFSSRLDADQWLSRLYKVVGTPPDMKTTSTAATG